MALTGTLVVNLTSTLTLTITEQANPMNTVTNQMGSHGRVKILPYVMWGLSDSAHKNASIYVDFTWFEITPIKITLVYKFEIEILGE